MSSTELTRNRDIGQPCFLPFSFILLLECLWFSLYLIIFVGYRLAVSFLYYAMYIPINITSKAFIIKVGIQKKTGQKLQCNNTKELSTFRKAGSGEVAFLREKHINWLSKNQWTAMKTYRIVTLCGLMSCKLCFQSWQVILLVDISLLLSLSYLYDRSYQPPRRKTGNT